MLTGAGEAEIARFIADYGLIRSDVDQLERWSALDGTSVDLVAADDPRHPDTLGTGHPLRRIVYGVADAASLDAIAAELGKDQAITRRADGSFDAIDPLGFAISFQLTCRQQLAIAPEPMNVPAPPRSARSTSWAAMPGSCRNCARCRISRCSCPIWRRWRRSISAASVSA